MWGALIIGIVAALGGRYLSGHVSGDQGSLRITVSYLFGLAAAAPAFAVMWECCRQLANNEDGTSGRPPDAEITRLLLLRECLLSALTTLGLLVSAGVLATGAQRQAVLANPRYGVSYPPAYVLIWGLAFRRCCSSTFSPHFAG